MNLSIPKLAILASIFLSVSAIADDTLSFKRLTNDEGTLNETIYDVDQDEYGFIWIASDKGVTRFDGENYLSFTFDPDDPSSLSSDNAISIEYIQGALWILTSNGVLHKLLANGYFERYAIPFAKGSDFSNGNIIAGSKGELWIFFNKKLYSFSTEESLFSLTNEFPDQISSISLHSPSDKLLVGFDSGKTKFCEASNITNCTSFIEFPNNEYLIKTISSQGSYYYVTNKNIYSYPSGQTTNINPALPANLNILINDAVINHDNHLWIATSHNGLYEYDLELNKIHVHKADFNDAYSIKSNNLIDLFINEQEVLWVGSQNDGVFSTNLKNTGFHRLVASDLAYANINRDDYCHISENAKGELFFSVCQAGFRKLSADRKLFEDLTPEILKALNSHSKNLFVKRHLYLSDSDIWIAAKEGLIHWNGKSSAQYIKPKQLSATNQPFNVDYIHQDNDNNIWFSSNNGVFLLTDPMKPQNLLKLNSLGNLFQDKKITFIEDAFDGFMWIGTVNSGLYLVNSKGEYTHFKNDPTNKSSLPNNQVNDITTFDNTNWWIATNSGLSHLIIDLKDKNKFTFHNHDRHESLENDSISSIIKDPNHFIWLATDDGVIKFDINSHANQLYDYGYGLPRGAYNTKSSIYSQDGYIYIGGKKGLAKINPDFITSASKRKIPIIFTSYRKANKNYSFIYPKKYPEIKLGYDNTNFRISYAKLDLAASEYIQYEYRLLGQSDNWHLVHNSNYVVYNHIPTGNYRLQVREKGNDENIAELTIDVAVSPWRTLKAYILYSLIIGALISILTYFYIKRNLARKKHEQQLYTLANYDSLTSLGNRNKLNKDLPNYLHSNPEDKLLAVIIIDLDRFKNINDSLGHDFGDKVLIYTASAIQEATPKLATCYRFAGDEFVIIIPELGDKRESHIICERLLEALNKTIEVDGIELNLNASIGISYSPKDSSDSIELMKFADSALYAAKNLGKGTYRNYEPTLQSTVIRRHVIESSVKSSFLSDSFFLQYQPKFSIKENKIIGFESLLRWKHEVLGNIPPNEFIPILEEMGMIQDIGSWVLDKALEQLSIWRNNIDQSLSIAVNISVKQLEGDSIVDEVKSLLKSYNLPASCLELEITETTLMKSAHKIMRTLHALRELGVKLSIDDFGTGYSSFYYLSQLPVDKLKIDKAFVDNIVHSQQAHLLFVAIVNMARSLKLEVIAEGIENEEQYNLVKKSECDNTQGYYISRPVGEEDVYSLLYSEDRLSG